MVGGRCLLATAATCVTDAERAVSLAANKVGPAPGSERIVRNGRAEVIAALFNSLALLDRGAWLVIEGIDRIQSGEE